MDIINKKLIFLLCAVGATVSTLTHATCEICGINAGRGERGFVFKLDEKSQTVNVLSEALFSSAAMAYDSDENLIYYVSASKPKTFSEGISPSTMVHYTL